jgi:uncharacterized membrane protein YjfL (UPF0719 family)
MDPITMLVSLGNTVLWSAVAIAIVVVVFELLDLRYHLRREVFEENSTAAAIFSAAFIVGIFYTVVQIVTN